MGILANNIAGYDMTPNLVINTTFHWKLSRRGYVKTLTSA